MFRNRPTGMYRRLGVGGLLPLLLPVLFAAPAAADYPADDAMLPELSAVRADIEAERYPAALATLQRLGRLQPDDADVFNLLGFVTRKTGDLDRSLVYYDRALRLDPDHIGAHEYRAELMLLLGDRAAAEAHLAALQRLCPEGCEELDELQALLAGEPQR